MPKSIRRFVLVAFVVAGLIVTPNLLGDGSCWYCFYLQFPPEIGGHHAMCWPADYHGTQGCTTIGPDVCVRFGGTCQNGI